MPKLTHAVPKYRKHKATGQAIVTIGGTDHYLGKHGTKPSRALYDRLIGEYLASGRRPIAVDPDEITVKEIAKAYWGYAKGYYVKDGKPTKELAAVKMIFRPVKRLYGDAPASEFGPLALKVIRQEWIRAGHSRDTINKNVQRIVRAFRWAASEELIPVLIPQTLATLAGLKKGRTTARETEPVRPIDLLIVEATMAELCDVVRDMIRVQLLTGMRPAEICKLRPRDIDRSGDVWEYRPESHKTEHHGRERVVYIGPEAQAVLSPYLLRDSETHCFRPADAVKQQKVAKHSKRKVPFSSGNRPGRKYDDGGLKGEKALWKPGEKYATDSYRRAIHRACDKAFLPPEPLVGDALKVWQSEHRWSPNRLRHTTGTDIRKRFGLEAAQVILGHSVADVTQIYAERDAEKAREVARQIG